MPLTAAGRRAAAVNGFNSEEHTVTEDEIHDGFPKEMTNSRHRHHKASKKRKPTWLIVVRFFARTSVLLLIMMCFAYLYLSKLRNQLYLMETKLEKMENEVTKYSVGLIVGVLHNQLNHVEKKLDKLEKDAKLAEFDSKKYSGDLIEGVLLNQLNHLEKKVEKIEKDAKLAEIEAKTYSRDLVAYEIEKHAADGIGRSDYALYANNILHSDTTSSEDVSFMVSPSFGQPFQCFSLKGNLGFVVIPLEVAIVFEAVTLEHIAESVSFYETARTTAPKDCRVSGWMHDPYYDTTAATSDDMTLLTKFSYDLDKKNPVQTFNVSDSAASSIIDTVRLDIDSNYGANYTCIYRLRVHGHKP